jgi:plasmid stability protein
MAQVLIRGLDDAVKRRLQVQARRRGVSMEAEAREILTRHLRPQGSRLERIRGLVAEFGGVDLDLPDRAEQQRPVELE